MTHEALAKRALWQEYLEKNPKLHGALVAILLHAFNYAAMPAKDASGRPLLTELEEWAAEHLKATPASAPPSAS